MNSEIMKKIKTNVFSGMQLTSQGNIIFNFEKSDYIDKQLCNTCRESTFRRTMTFVCIGKRWHSLCFYCMIVDIFNHFFACLDRRCISDYEAE